MIFIKRCVFLPWIIVAEKILKIVMVACFVQGEKSVRVSFGLVLGNPGQIGKPVKIVIRFQQ